VLTNYRFLTKPSWDLALTLQRIYENCRISRLETLFKSRSKPDSGTGICTSVGQATVVDLTGSNDSGTIDGAQFVFTTPQPTGTGVIQPFLRLENFPVEQGYNTSGGTPFDDKAGPWTHDLTFGDLQNTQVTLGRASYFKLCWTSMNLAAASH